MIRINSTHNGVATEIVTASLSAVEMFTDGTCRIILNPMWRQGDDNKSAIVTITIDENTWKEMLRWTR